MKFWRHLSELLDQTIPEWRDKYVAYKALKKEIKKSYPKNDLDDFDTRPNKRPRLDGDDHVDVVEFEKLLEDEIEKVNDFFLDKQQEYIIKLEVLREKIADTVNSGPETVKIIKDMADFHGEMVLLMNYSQLNYLGITKILKKYDKRSGALIRMPFIQRVRQEQFCKTDVLGDLVKECYALSTSTKASKERNHSKDIGEQHKVPQVVETLAVAEGENMENPNVYVRFCSIAFQTLKKIRSQSSTPNELSLPPL